MKYEDFVTLLNSLMSRNFKFFDKKARKQFEYLIKNGVTDVDFKKVIINAYLDKHHKDSNFQYLTPEFLTRTNIVERYLAMPDPKPSEDEEKLSATEKFSNFIDNLLNH